MKLKAVFIIFNAIVVVTFLLVFLMPLFFLGFEFTMVFWRSNWYLAVLFFLVLAILNGYFVINWPLFSALEREDWHGIAGVLEKRVHQRHRYSDQNIRLLVNASVVTGRPEKIVALEKHLREHKPDLVRRHVLRLAIPHLLSNDGDEIARYFQEFRRAGPGSGATGSRGSTEQAFWIEWGYAFGLMLQGQLQEGRATLTRIVDEAPAGIVRAISLYLLVPHSGSDGVVSDGDAADGTTPDGEARRAALVAALPRDQWRKKVEREQSELHVLVLGRLLRDVEEWLYATPVSPGD